MNEEKTKQLVPLKTVLYAGDTLVAELLDPYIWNQVLKAAIDHDQKSKVPKGGMAQP